MNKVLFLEFGLNKVFLNKVFKQNRNQLSCWFVVVCANHSEKAQFMKNDNNISQYQLPKLNVYPNRNANKYHLLSHHHYHLQIMISRWCEFRCFPETKNKFAKHKHQSLGLCFEQYFSKHQYTRFVFRENKIF